MTRKHEHSEPRERRSPDATLTNTDEFIADLNLPQLPEGIPLNRIEGADLSRICGRVLQEFRLLHPGRRFVYEADGNAIGQWDESRLEQVVQNLVDNALKYGSPRSPVIVRWSRRGDQLQGDVILSVHNDGDPIAEELLPHVFERYRSGARRPETRARGMGLGLFIVHEIVRAHGGEIDVESKPGTGTTFTVTLPARAAE